MQFPATLGSAGRKAPTPWRQPDREIFFRLDLSISCNFQQLWVQLAEKPPTEMGRDLVRDPAHITHGEYPWSPYYKSTLRFLLSKYLLYDSNCVNFSKYSDIQNYRTQDHGAGGRPIGSLATIHTNIPATTVILLGMSL